MSGRIWTIFRYELRRNGRRRGFLFSTFGIPLLGFLGLMIVQAISAGGGMGNLESSRSPIDIVGEPIRQAGYVDQSGLFPDPGDEARLTLYTDEAAAGAALDAGAIDVYYIIAPDYLATGDVTLVMPRLNLNQINPAPIRRVMLTRLSEDVRDPDVLRRLLEPATFNDVLLQRTVPEGETASEGGAFFVVYVFTILLLVGLFVTNGYLMQSLIEEKETRLIEILMSSVRPGQLLAGKILALGLLGLLQIVVWLGSVLLIAQVSGAGALTGSVASFLGGLYIPPLLLPLVVVYYVLAYLMFAGLYSIVGALSNSVRDGSQYAALFTLPAIVPLWLTQLFMSDPNGTAAVVLSLFPLSAPLGMIQRLALAEVPALQIVASIGLMALAVVGVMWLAGRVFRVQTLLAGQAPRLRDLPRLLRA